MAILKNLNNYLEKYPHNRTNIVHQYGTAGFRDKAEYLSHIMFRTGILATLRSRAIKGIVGVMITASHNPEEDNGLKIIEPDGSMLEQSWEILATKIANIHDNELEAYVAELISKFNLNIENRGKIFLAKDTRSSSSALSGALIDGIKCSNGEFIDFNLLTTPQLHYIIRCANFPDYGQPTENGYYEKISNAFLKLTEHSNKKLQLTVDCANGVGALKMKLLAPYLQKKISFNLVNTGNGILNYRCGADFVKVNQTNPDTIPLKIDHHYASFDGDADRLIYFYKNKQDSLFHMLDGDKIAVLVAKFLAKLLVDAGLDQIKIAVVQTAYANGSSTEYIKEVLKLAVDCVPTGVKHLHHQAKQSEIGVYFEANGHGTILFSEQTQKQIAKCGNEKAGKILNFIDLVNQTVGDAISDMLVVEAILDYLNLTIEEWDSFYVDLPNKLLKVTVKDRNVIQTADAERKCIKPDGLQLAIDQTIGKFGNQARSFIRPSGTEDVVRIYAEASTKEMADNLAKTVANLVYDYANGTGDKF